MREGALRLLYVASIALIAFGIVLALIVFRRLGGIYLHPQPRSGIGFPWQAEWAILAGLAIACIALILGPATRITERLATWRALVALEVVALAAACLVMVAIVGRIIVMGAYFTWDEAVYALTARAWVEGTPITGWAAHRPPGVSVLGVLTLLVSHADGAFRLWGLLAGLLTVIGAWWVARGMAGPVAGILAAGAVVGIQPLLLNSALYLTDVPAAALLVILIGFLWRRFTSARSLAPMLLLAAPIAAAAFYVRYGASLPIAFIGVTCLLLWPRRSVAGWKVLLATVVTLLILLIPHFIFAISRTGVPWGIALGARDLAAPVHPGDALRTYLAGFPLRIAGPAPGIAMVVGLVSWGLALIESVVRRRWTDEARALSLLVLPAIATGLVLGIVALAQVRYVLLPIVLLTVAGPVGAAMAWRRVMAATHSDERELDRSPRLEGVRRLPIGVIAMAAVIATGVLWVTTRFSVVLAAGALDAERQSGLPAVATQLREMAGGESCSVLTSIVPNITWTTGCAAYGFGYPPVAGHQHDLTGRRHFLLFIRGDAARQPQGGLRSAYTALATGPPVVIQEPRTGLEAGTIYPLP